MIIHEVAIGDTVQLKKTHPCGGLIWKIDRIGVDIGMVCQTCERRVVVPRSKFNKRVKKVLTP